MFARLFRSLLTFDFEDETGGGIEARAALLAITRWANRVERYLHQIASLQQAKHPDRLAAAVKSIHDG